jgi:hypothetical protein
MQSKPLQTDGASCISGEGTSHLLPPLRWPESLRTGGVGHSSGMPALSRPAK